MNSAESLNVRGADDLLAACRNCYASLFTDRAIVYREEQGFDHLDVALSVGVQQMVRADKAGAGVMFTIDTERGYRDKTDYFVDRLSLGIARIAAAQYPDPVIVRMSDFKSNEYADLIGGREFEPDEENPMLGFRGAARYYSDEYRPGFVLECRAIRHVREEIGLDNVVVMIPFCRTPDEADRVLETMAETGLVRGDAGLRVYVMAEIPANVILAKQFAARFDGFSIGSNDLTQLTLGVDRDSTRLKELFDERDPSIKEMVRLLI